ncbi:Histone H2A.1 [Bienertia sinuspersici]
MRGLSVVTGAGPSNSQLIFAFAFPITLLALLSLLLSESVIDLTRNSLRSNKRSRKESDDATQVAISRKEEPALSRARNRPKREV